MRKTVNGAWQFCCLCQGDARRRKTQKRSVYDVDCVRCGSFRIGLKGELAMKRKESDDRQRAVQQVREANQNGLIHDFITGSDVSDARRRLGANPGPWEN